MGMGVTLLKKEFIKYGFVGIFWNFLEIFSFSKSTLQVAPSEAAGCSSK